MSKERQPTRGVGIKEIPLTDLWNLAQKKAKERNANLTASANCYPMGVLPDWAIREFVSIEPLIEKQEKTPGTISNGLTSAGYDLSCGYKFKVFTNARCATVDPKDFDEAAFLEVDLTPDRCEPETYYAHDDYPSSYPHFRCSRCVKTLDPKDKEPPFCSKSTKPKSVLIPPNSFALAESLEYVFIPANVICVCLGKSSYARCGVNLNMTPLEPGWHGIVTLEIINGTPLPVRIHAGEGIAQALFHLLTSRPEKTYGEKSSPCYQAQTGLTTPRT